MLSEERKKEAVEKLEDFLCECGYIDCEDGLYVEHIYANYDDRVDDRDVDTALLSDDPEVAVTEMIESAYEFYMDDTRYTYVKNVMRNLYPNDKEEEDELRDFLFEKLCEILLFEIPYDHYLKQEYRADLMIDTGDSNYDYGSNSVYPYYYGEKGSGIDKEASLVWLAGTQGFSKRQLERALDEGDLANPKGFLESVRQEVANETSSMNCLTFLVRMTLEDLIKLNGMIRLQEPYGEKIYNADLRPDCGTLTISKKAQPGLYDPWNGAGSVFEIQLEKDIELPVKYIRSCLPDCHFRWSVDSVYAMHGSAWQDVVIDIRKAV